MVGMYENEFIHIDLRYVKRPKYFYMMAHASFQGNNLLYIASKV